MGFGDRDHGSGVDRTAKPARHSASAAFRVFRGMGQINLLCMVV